MAPQPRDLAVYGTSDTFGFNYDGSWVGQRIDPWELMTTGECRPKLDRESIYFAGVEHRQWWLSHAAISKIPPA